jgi:hypothetical protein
MSEDEDMTTLAVAKELRPRKLTRYKEKVMEPDVR